jgi:hypothetical protein
VVVKTQLSDLTESIKFSSISFIGSRRMSKELMFTKSSFYRKKIDSNDTDRLADPNLGGLIEPSVIFPRRLRAETSNN